MYQVNFVSSKKDWEDFLGVPWRIYDGNPTWVPPLRIAVRDMLDVNRNPFFKHASMYPLIARDSSGSPAGRIVGVVDDNHNAFHREATAFFGFFECIEDQNLANLLLDGVASWAREKAMGVLRGPLNLSTNHEVGLLVEGFQDPPAVMMTYNPSYYSGLFEAWGLAKAKDLFAYTVKRESRFSERLLAQAERLKQRGRVTFRPIDMGRFDEEIGHVLDIYNDAWERNWGFVPMSPEEFRHMAKDLKAIVDPELLLIAEVAGEPAGFALALPDVNQAIHKVRDGRLFPTGLVKLLWNVKGPGRRKTIKRCRILTLGIKQKFREVGVGPLLYAEYLSRGPRRGYPEGEASWILEDNVQMNRALEEMCGKRTKVYRIYDRALA